MHRISDPAGRIAQVASLLGEMSREVVFTGGATVGLFITDAAAPPIRPTIDIDVIVEVTTTMQYYSFQDRLRARGFTEDISSGIICRWRHDSIILDVMPTDAHILGFSNRWYAATFSSARTLFVYDTPIRVSTPPYLLGTKLEAFHGRGDGDYMLSHDMEDIIALIDGRHELIEEVSKEDSELRSYLRREFSTLLDTPAFMDALPGYLPGDRASQQRLPLLMNRIEYLAGRRQVP